MYKILTHRWDFNFLACQLTGRFSKIRTNFLPGGFTSGPLIWICNLLLIILLHASCKNSQPLDEQEEYDGPVVESYEVETVISDSGIVKLKIKGAKQLTYQDGDYEYPEGVFIEFYDVYGKVTSTLKANRGYYTVKEDIYKVEEDVEMNNFEKGEKLNSEELFWKPKKEEIYTDKFVNITTESHIIKGVGLTAKQDFSSYIIKKTTGRILIDQ